MLKLAAHKERGFTFFFTVSALLCFVNFFITANPYAALHSGATAADMVTHSHSFALQSNLLTAAAIFIAYGFAFKTSILLPTYSIIWGFILILSGIFTSTIISRPHTYAFDIILPTMIFAMAKYDCLYSARGINLKIPYSLSAAILIIAIAASILRPNVWGYLPLDFSRESRGEVTLAMMTGAIVILPAASLAMHSVSRTARIAIYSLTLFIVASTATRSLIVMTLIPLVMFSAFRAKGIKRAAFILTMSIAIAYGFYALQETFILEAAGKSTLEATLTGRFSLWTYYWDAFLRSPVFGNGAFLLEKVFDYSGEASSEIGVLKTAAEHGIIAASLQLIAVIVAVFNAIKLLHQKNGSELDELTAYLVLAMTPNFLLQSHARVLNFADCLFWYSVFWHLSLSRNVLSLTMRFDLLPFHAKRKPPATI